MIKKAQGTPTAVKYILMVVLIVLLIFFVYPFFRDNVIPWAKSLGLGGNITRPSSSGSSSGTSGGVAISAINTASIPGFNYGENPCPIKIGGLLDETSCRSFGKDYYRYVYIDGKKTNFLFPKSLENIDYNHLYLCSDKGTNIFWNSWIKLPLATVSLGNLPIVLHTIGFFPTLFKNYHIYDDGYISVEDIATLKKLEGAYLNPEQIKDLGDVNKEIDICVNNKIKENQDSRAKQQEIGYVHYYINDKDVKWIALALGNGGELNTDSSHIFFTNIKIDGNQIQLFPNGKDGSDGATSMAIGKIDVVGKINIYPEMLISDKKHEESYREFLEIPETLESSSNCKKYGIDKNSGYCRYGELVYVLKQLDQAYIGYYGAISSIPGDEKDIVESLIIKLKE